MLARDNGWVECADVIKEWKVERDGDSPLQPPPTIRDPDTVSDGGHGSKRVHVKRSIDNALHLLKSSHPYHSSININLPPSPSSATLPRVTASPGFRPLGEYTFYPTTTTTPPSVTDDIYARRPSLPHILSIDPMSSRSGRSTTRRPKSAGTGADQRQGQDGMENGRKLTNRFSLLNMLKQGSSESATVTMAATSGSRNASSARKEVENGAVSTGVSQLPHHRVSTRKHQRARCRIGSTREWEARLACRVRSERLQSICTMR
ncbi:hypothetical protein BD410DRAFT_625192 [Rickenella mellea]|uniref:Uncharacterized protein n=1 Tax=Rickenella mellea TaxID=50990 RepID=A0A4Y7PMJ2_9AGAM|nr:hypothetical protein BD410DRAFT_625192 [Rickenella mellea]